MPAKRSLWAKGIINFNYLIITIHLWASRVISPARASGTAGEKRDSANLSYWTCLFYLLVSRNGVLQMRCTDTRETLSE